MWSLTYNSRQEKQGYTVSKSASDITAPDKVYFFLNPLSPIHLSCVIGQTAQDECNFGGNDAFQQHIPALKYYTPEKVDILARDWQIQRSRTLIPGIVYFPFRFQACCD